MIKDTNTRVVLWEWVEVAPNPPDFNTIGSFHAQQLLILQLLTAAAVLETRGSFAPISGEDDILFLASTLSSRRRLNIKVMPGHPLTDLGVAQASAVGRLPPEVVRGEEIGVGTPAWSVAAIAFEVVTGGAAAFGDHSEFPKKFFRIIECEYDVEKLGALSPNGKDFFASIFKKQKEDRPSIDSLLQHPWFQEKVTSEERAQLLRTDVLKDLIPPHLLPTDIASRLSLHMPYVERWSLYDTLKREKIQSESGGTGGEREETVVVDDPENSPSSS